MRYKREEGYVYVVVVWGLVDGAWLWGIWGYSLLGFFFFFNGGI